jgi:signal transduction histidine kinase
LRLKNEVSLYLSASLDIPELSTRLIQEMALILPFMEIELYLYKKNTNWFVRATYQNDTRPPDQKAEISSDISLYPCRGCLATNKIRLHPLASCQQEGNFLQTRGTNGFCLPLIDSIWPVGLLHLYPSQQTLGAGQIEVLENISADLSRAIGAVVDEISRDESMLTQKIYAMQLDIARDLHDTVGQNISYLRMKLEHLSEVGSQKQTDMTMEVQTMSRVANESYDLIRGTLAVLQSENSADLFRWFTRYGQQIEERSSFKIDFSSQGEPRLMSANRMRQLFYIFREILNNIEKHARASQVSMEMTWDEHDLTFVVFDNGEGFDPDKYNIVTTVLGS